MSTMKTASSIFVLSSEGVPRISDAGRTKLLVILEQSRAEIAAGNFDVLKPGTPRKEFEAILDNDPSDQEPDELLGIPPRSVA
jgi:hypothetical protein